MPTLLCSAWLTTLHQPHSPLRSCQTAQQGEDRQWSSRLMISLQRVKDYFPFIARRFSIVLDRAGTYKLYSSYHALNKTVLVGPVQVLAGPPSGETSYLSGAANQHTLMKSPTPPHPPLPVKQLYCMPHAGPSSGWTRSSISLKLSLRDQFGNHIRSSDTIQSVDVFFLPTCECALQLQESGSDIIITMQ